MEAGTYHSITVEYREIRGSAKCRLQWESPSTPFDVIPSSNLFHLEHLAGSPTNYTVIPAIASGSKSTPSGLGLFKGVATEPHKFVIQSRDSFNNFRGDWDLGYGGTVAFGQQYDQSQTSR